MPVIVERPLRFGVHSGQQYADLGALKGLWQAAEELGYDWVSVFDHFRPELGGLDGPCLEGTTTLAALAAATSRVRCALLVATPTWRHPAVTAAVAATLDHISGGRLELGMGAGGGDRAYAQWGIPFPAAGERLARLDEACHVLRGLWDHPVTSFAGDYYRLSAARLAPKPVQRHLPLVIGGAGRRLLHIAGTHADTWNSLAAGVPILRRRRAVLDAACRAQGRDPASVRSSITFRVVLGLGRQAAEWRRTERFALLPPSSSDIGEYLAAGTPQECVAELSAYAEAGVGDFLLGLRPPVDLETLELFATHVVPALRARRPIG